MRIKKKLPMPQIILPILLIVSLLILWETSTRFLNIDKFILPSPTDITSSIAAYYELLLYHSLTTFGEALAGLLCACVIGGALALWIQVSNFAKNAFQPILAAFQSFPKEAIAPLLVIWFGFGYLSKVVLAASIAFFPIFIGTYLGLMSVPSDTINVLKAIKARDNFILFRVRLNYALPNIISSLRVAWTLSIIGAVIAEFVGASSGLGYLILIANSQFDVSLVFASLLVLAIGGLLGDLGFRALMAWIAPWFGDARSMNLGR